MMLFRLSYKNYIAAIHRILFTHSFSARIIATAIGNCKREFESIKVGFERRQLPCLKSKRSCWHIPAVWTHRLNNSGLFCWGVCNSPVLSFWIIGFRSESQPDDRSLWLGQSTGQRWSFGSARRIIPTNQKKRQRMREQSLAFDVFLFCFATVILYKIWG